MMDGYAHKEAFCLMLYQSPKTKHVVDIWNSRDGVTPFNVFIDEDEYLHIAFNFDRCVPWFRPKDGTYVFEGPHDAPRLVRVGEEQPS